MEENGKRFAQADEKTKVIHLYEKKDREETPAPARHADQDKRLKEKNSKKLEKLLKKQKRREMRLNHLKPTEDESDNTETAAEEKPSEEVSQELTAPVKKKKDYNIKRIVIVAMIVILLFGIVFFAFNSDKLSVHNITNFFRYGVLNSKSEEKFPLDIKGENISAGNFIRSGQDLCYSSDTKIQMLNNYGRSIYTAQHAFITPVLTVGKKGSLVYNLGGTGYEIVSAEGQTYMAEAKDNILVADYADNGSYAIVTESNGYLSKLYVYDEKHEQIFAYSFADYYVTSVSLNSSGTKAVVAGVSALDGVDIASLYVLDFTKDTPLYFSELENNIIYEASYIGDKYACAIGRSASYVINTYNGDLVTNDYAGSALTAYDINNDTNTYTLSLSGSGDGRNCDIVSYTTDGREDRRFTAQEKIIGISTYKGRVALLTNESVILYSKSGNRYSEKVLSSDPHSVVLYTTSDAYVLCTGYIDTVSL